MYIFKYDELAIIKKGSFRVVKVGIKFDSKVTNKKRNKSKISYYIEGYDMRNWCYYEELKKISIINRILFYIFRKKYF